MVDDDLHAMLLVVAVDLLVCGDEELFKHLRGEEGGVVGTPVVVVEHRVGMGVLAELLGQLQLVFGDVIDQLVHLVGVGVEGHQRLLNAHQVVHLLEDAGGDGGGNKVLLPVDGRRCRLVGRPGLVGEVRAGHLHGLLPLGDVLHHPVFVVMDGELAGQTGGPVLGDAPGVHHRAAAGGAAGGLAGDGVAPDHGEELVLVYKAVRVAAADGLKEILTNGKHSCLLLKSHVVMR